MMTMTLFSFSASFRRGCALALVVAAPLLAGASADPFVGRWALTLPKGGAGWLEIRAENDALTGGLLWAVGSVLPLASVRVADGTLTATQYHTFDRRDAAGKVVGTQQIEVVVSAQLKDDSLTGIRTIQREDGEGVVRAEFTGHRIPPMPARPDLSKVKFGAPIPLFNGCDLDGWRLVEAEADNDWSVEHGELVNRPLEREGRRHGNLRTEREFEDFNLTLEGNLPAESNSGVYLRGIYEVQLENPDGRPPDAESMGAIYSRITPAASAENPAGEWQKFDITLVDRHVTVVLNGVKIIDSQPLAGCTGGALWADELRPGPIYLQGDHGVVRYRNLVLRPVVK